MSLDEAHGDVELTAVVLAGGKQNHLYPLCEDDVPLSLLPVANRPLISFQLELLERSGFTEVLLIAMESVSERLASFITEMYNGPLHIIVEEVADALGSAEALRAVAHHIRTDFALFSGDIITDVVLNNMADIHRLQAATMTMLLSESPVDGSKGGAKQKKRNVEELTTGEFVDYIGVDPDDHRVLFMRAGADLDTELVLRKSLLRSHTNILIRRDLLDTHCYLFKRSVLDILDNHPQWKSVKGELVPHLVKLQFRITESTAADAEAIRTDASFTGVSAAAAAGARGGDEEDGGRDLADDNFEANLTLEALNVPDYAEIPFLMSSTTGSHTMDRIRCYAYMTEAPTYSKRAITLENYREMNAHIAKAGVCVYVPFEPLVRNQHYIDSTAEISEQTKVGPDCVVGEHTTIGDRCSVKRSVIGRHCRIGNNVKVSDCVIMDNVTIEPGCHVSQSIICHQVTLTDCKLKDCRVAHKVSLAGEERSGQVYVAGTTGSQRGAGSTTAGGGAA